MLTVANDRDEPIEIQVDIFQKRVIISPITNAVLLPQPPWKAAKIPFRANVWPWSGDNPKSQLSAKIKEGSAIPVVAEIPLSLPRLMDVPGKISVHTVHTCQSSLH
ncbi:hypothetical protein D3C77_478190 [compost metagenome]